MSVRYVRRPNNTQPDGVLSVDARFSHNLVGVWVPGLTTFELVSRSVPSTEATFTRQAQSGQYGGGVGINVTATGRRYTFSAVNNQPRLAWIIVAHRSSAATGSLQSVVRQNSAWLPLQEEASGNVRAAVWEGAAARISNYGAASLYQGRVNVFAGHVTPTNAQTWANQQALAGFTGWTGGNIGSSGTAFCLGATETGTEVATPWTVLLVAAWSGPSIPGITEIQDLSQSPWQLFEPRRILVPVAAAGGALNIDLDSGSYVYTGQDATLAVTRAINLDAGSYSYTGQTATLSYGRALSLDAGSYTYTGQTADFTIARKIDLDTGSYAYTGQDTTLSYTPSGSTYNIDLDAGAYTYTGQAVDFTIARNLALDAGVYTYTGQDAGLAYSGASSVTIKAGSWLRYRVI